MNDGTYGIKGLPRPEGLTDKTVNIPYVPNMPVRYNIATLATNHALRKQWTLFVLALERFKNIPVAEKLSYFRVAGIHVSPNQSWDGAPKPPGSSEGHIIPGYCFHNGLNFPTWHRPYMLLFEQCIWDNMKAIIHDWVKLGLSQNDEEKWQQAANTWRLPYWDWAAQQTYAEDFALPEVLVQGPVHIYPPAQVKNHYPPGGLYPNPFWGFENPEKDENDDPRPFGDMPDEAKAWAIHGNPKTGAPWDKVSGTSRYGLFRTIKHPKQLLTLGPQEDQYTYRGLRGVNNGWQANAVLAAMKKHWYDPDPDDSQDSEDGAGAEGKDREAEFTGPGSLSDAVNRMLSPGYHKYWEQFSSTKWLSDHHPTEHATGYLSLEYIHNNVHNVTGGADWNLGIGHMGDVTVAAFDPVFWLHHCQVDRLFAIWQCLNWDHWWDGSDSEDKGGKDDRWTLLQPFHMKDNDPEMSTYTSDECRDFTKLNYTYDDLDDAASGALKTDGSGMLDEEKYTAALRRRMNEMYPGSANVLATMKKDPVLQVPVGLMPSRDDIIGGEPTPWNDFIINVLYDRYALQGAAYSIEFYLGGPKARRKTTFHPRNFVGRVYTFSNGQGESCPNCTSQETAGILSRGQVPLTLHLLHHAIDSVDDHSLDPSADDGVEEYLKNHLQWRFVRFGGEVVSASLFSKTRVTVLRGSGELRGPDKEYLRGSGDHVPVYRNYSALPHITAGKAWGVHPEDG